MTANRMVPVVAMVIAATGSPPTAAQGQPAGARTGPKVDIVQTVGCAERRSGEGAEWWITQAVDPTVTRGGVFNELQVEEARNASLGSRTFQLVGYADFLDAEGLLQTADRARFTTPEQANATGELREGRTVLVKGALIETDTDPRINLLSVVAVSETCG